MVNIVNAQKKLDRIKQQAQSLPWNEAGVIILREIDASFDKGGAYKRQGSFEGGNRRWVKRKNPAKHKILQKTLKMRRRIKAIAQTKGLTIKSTMVYSATQHYGDKRKINGKKRNISSRPFIVYHLKAKREVNKLFKAYLSDV